MSQLDKNAIISDIKKLIIANRNWSKKNKWHDDVQKTVLISEECYVSVVPWHGLIRVKYSELFRAKKKCAKGKKCHCNELK